MLKILHTADLHFSVNADKLAEVVRTTDALLQSAAANVPDLIVLAGDTIDQYDGKIPADSACFRAAKSFIHRAADIAPVVMIRGTKSHDKDISGLFDDIYARCQIYVASDVCQVQFVVDEMTGVRRFIPIGKDGNGMETPIAVLTLVPSLDKSWIAANATESVASGNIQYRELLHDLFSGLGQIRYVPGFTDIPHIAVLHGMLTGSSMGGYTAVGEDLEFSLNDLAQMKAEAVLLGHIHAHQRFGNVAYSGSPSRLTFGETEDKGFLMWMFSPVAVTCDFVPLPARRFVLEDFGEMDDPVFGRFARLLKAVTDDCLDADVRIRFSVAEERRNEVDRDAIVNSVLAAGARKCKVEMQVVPKVRQRAAGISRSSSLPEKLQKWAESVGEPVPDAVMALAGIIEGKSIEELMADALAVQSVPVLMPMVEEVQDSLFSGVA